MINWTIEGTPLDMSYDYGHLFSAFPTLMQGTAVYELNQVVSEDKIVSTLIKTGSEEIWHQETLWSALNASFQLKKDLKVFLKLNAHDLLSQIEPSTNPYGTLVGIRPVKLVHELLRLKRSKEEISACLKAFYRVSDEKIALMQQIATLEQPILEADDDGKISLYICIPFCRTRCLYCSFPANSVSQKGHLMDKYVDCLTKEINAMSIDLKQRGLMVDCIYIGGGTPTALNHAQLENLLKTVTTVFDMSAVQEFTVEAGRPDTLDSEKLALIKHYGVDRICVNPQTMVNETLKAIGRDHTAEAVTQLYNEAKAYNFSSINMDLIAGLDQEGLPEMNKTLDEVLALRPENITLHTLALKRASKLNELGQGSNMQSAETVSEMVGVATSRLMAAGYEPYYMYRQKQMIGNLENIGFALPGKVCLYNVRIMEEQHSIVALGAGAISKVYFADENRLERFSNSKGLEDYMARIDEMIAKKKEWLTSRYDFSIME